MSAFDSLMPTHSMVARAAYKSLTNPQNPMQTTMTDIQKAALEYADERNALEEIVEALNHKIEALRLEALRPIKRAVARSAEKRAALGALIDANRSLFDRPRTVIFHGIKLGLRKGAGAVDWEDDARTVDLIRQHFSKSEAARLIKTTEKPKAKELLELDASDLRKIGCTLEETGDVIVISAVDSEVDKIVAALLKSATDEAEESAAA